MSGARKSKPLKLKESVESGNAGFDVKEFLGKGAQLKAMVPSSHSANEVDQTAVIDPFAQNPSATVNLHLVETQNATQEFSKTLPLPGRVFENSPGVALDQTSTSILNPELEKKKVSKKQSSVKWIDANAVAASEAAKLEQQRKPVQKESSMGPVAMLVGALGLIAYVVLAPTDPTGTGAGKKMSAEQLKERLEYHQKMTGWRLNNERIETQIENHYKAPGLPAGVQKVKPADMMAGLPLEGERSSMEGMRDKTLPVNPTYADAKVMYGLQEEQDRIETEKRAEKLYMQEFIENAAADGYDVEVDKNGRILEVRKLKQDGIGTNLQYED